MLVCVGVWFLVSGGFELLDGVLRGEAYWCALDFEDWFVLLEDYVLRCLVPNGDRCVGDRYEVVVVVLREFGF